MNHKNMFLMNLWKSPRLSMYSFEKKQKIIKRIMSDPDMKNILSSIKYGNENKLIHIEATRENRIIAKEQEMFEKGLVGSYISKKKCAKSKTGNNKFGRTDLHHFIIINNKEMIKKILEKGENLLTNDNNGQNPYELALLEENKEIISIMKPYYEK